MRYWHQRADERHGNPPPGAISGQRQSWKTPREASPCMVCDIFPFSALTLLGDRKGIWPIKNLDVGLLVVMI